MNADLLFDSFSHLDGSLIERSERPARPRRVRALKIAACFALLAALAASPMLARRQRPAAMPSGTETLFVQTSETAAAPIEDETPPAESSAPAVKYAPTQPFGAPLTEAASVLPMIETYPLSADACYAAPENGEANRSMPLRAAMEQYGEGARYRVIVDLFRDGQPLPADGAEAQAERERLAALGWTVAYETLTGEDQRTRHYFTLHADYRQLADFPVSGEYGYLLFLYGEYEPSATPQPPAVYSESQLSTGSIPTESIEVCGVPPFSGETLTHEQAYADPDFGAYLCDAPEGFTEWEFFLAGGVLSAHFRRGYDYVDWYVSRGTDDPAVAAADLTRELVAERMYRADDAGDTDGWRIMNFCVDYGGVSVRVTAKGVSPEWLYGQLVAPA